MSISPFTPRTKKIYRLYPIESVAAGQLRFLMDEWDYSKRERVCVYEDHKRDSQVSCDCGYVFADSGVRCLSAGHELTVDFLRSGQNDEAATAVKNGRGDQQECKG